MDVPPLLVYGDGRTAFSDAYWTRRIELALGMAAVCATGSVPWWLDMFSAYLLNRATTCLIPSSWVIRLGANEDELRTSVAVVTDSWALRFTVPGTTLRCTTCLALLRFATAQR